MNSVSLAAINFGTNIVGKYYWFRRFFRRPIWERIGPFLEYFKKPCIWL